MGRLVDGIWQDVWYDTAATKGHFKRSESQFRNWITADGSAGPSGEGGFKAEAGRYHLYVSLACPWAHRTLIFRKLKKLEDLISVSVVDYLMLENGIFVFGLTQSERVPFMLELGVLLDVFVGVFIMGIVVFHINREFDSLDATSLPEHDQ